MHPFEIACDAIGVHEDPIGSNDSPEIREYLKSVGVKIPAPWCMAFVYWCFHQVYGDKLPLFRSGGVLSTWNSTNKKYRVTSPQTGDIVFFDYGLGKGHAGIVIAVYPDRFATIEGNTNDDGSREGYEVCRRERLLSDKKIKGYIRIPEPEDL